MSKQCRRILPGMRPAVETAGHVPWENFKTVSDLVELFLYDLKHHDPAKNSSGASAGNRLILRNLQELRFRSAQAIIRVPVTPGNSGKGAHRTDRGIESERAKPAGSDDEHMKQLCAADVCTIIGLYRELHIQEE